MCRVSVKYCSDFVAVVHRIRFYVSRALLQCRVSTLHAAGARSPIVCGPRFLAPHSLVALYTPAPVHCNCKTTATNTMSISTFRATGQLRGAVHASAQSPTQKASSIRCSMGLHTQGTALGVGLPMMAPTRRVSAGRSLRCSVVKAVAAPVEFDPEKEESLKYKRVVFDFDLWAKHRSSSRYSRHIFTMLTYVVRGCAGVLLRH